MPVVSLTTYKDEIDHLTDYLGASVSSEGLRNTRRAIQSAYRIFATAARWHYFYSRGRIVTVSPQTTGTIAYDHTGGTYERMVTLTGASWPSWAGFGGLIIDNIPYFIATRKSSSIVTLSINSNPGDDVAAGTSYTLFRDTFPLPSDFLASDEFVNLNFGPYPMYCHPTEILLQARLQNTPATPRHFTFTGDPHAMGTLAVRFFPMPDNVYKMDFIYQRRPRPLLVEDYNTGTVAVSAPSTTVTGTGTTWTSSMIGSVIRISNSTSLVPDGLGGDNPYVNGGVERTIMDVTSTTAITVDATISTTYSGVKYRISDPVDIEDASMLAAFQRCAEREVSLTSKMKDRQLAEQDYVRALILAREADSRFFGEQRAGGPPRYPYRLRDMPRGADVG